MSVRFRLGYHTTVDVDKTPGEITLLLKQVAGGDAMATETLAEAVYAELRRIATRLMAHERSNHTLQPTQLAGEAFLNLIDQTERKWENRAHFFAVAAQAMRRILVDYSRRKRSSRRGGEWRRVELESTSVASSSRHEDILAIDEALERLQRIDARQSRIVELRYFGGLTETEVAKVLGISDRTVKREWLVARSWLYAELTEKPSK